MGLRVGIFDTDSLYMQRLMAYVNDVKGHGESGFTFYGYSSAEQLKQSALSNEIDMLLIPEACRELVGEITLPAFILTTGRGKGGVFKYSRADQILNELKGRFVHEKQEVVTGQSMVIGVCSPLGRSGKTRLAKGICNCFKDSLYIAFGDYQTRGTDEEMLMIDRLLFMIAGRDESFCNLIKPDAGELLKGAEHLELRQLSWEDVAFMISVLKERTNYRYIVFDLGTGAMSDLKVLLGCDRIFVTTLQDEYAYERLDVFKKQLSYGPLSALNSKIKYMQVAQDDTSLAAWIRRELA